MTEDQKRDFVADVTGFLLEEVDDGADVFVLLSFKHREGRDSMKVTSASIKVNKSPRDDRMAERAGELVSELMDRMAPKWRDN